MKNLKYYVIDTLLNTVSDDFSNFYEAENEIQNILDEQGRYDWRDETRFIIIPRWDK